MLTDINAKVVYIETNLGTLTRQEYRTSGNISISCSGRVGKTVQLVFDKIFIEPPSVSAYYTYNEDNDFDGITISNITCTGFSMYTAYSGNSSKTCTIAWTAIGYISKQISF